MEKLTSREFEKRILYELDFQAKRMRCSAGRYGVQAAILPGTNPLRQQLEELSVAISSVEDALRNSRGPWSGVGNRLSPIPGIFASIGQMLAYQPRPEWRPIASLPDFEGVLPGGRQFIFDAKIVSGASFPLTDDHFQRRQKKHLYQRSLMGCVTFLLIHFQERELKKTGLQEALTVAFPVFPDHPFWDRVDAGQEKRVTRSDAAQYGVPVEWTSDRGKTRPIVLDAILAVAGRMPVTGNGAMAG